MKPKPVMWKSLKNGNEYPYDEYANHGKGGVHCALVAGLGMVCRNDLPKDEYPFTIVFEEPKLPEWMK